MNECTVHVNSNISRSSLQSGMKNFLHRAEWLLSLSTDSSSIGPRVMHCTFNEIMNDDKFIVGTVFFLPSSHFCREKIHLCTSPMSRFHGQGAQPTKKIVYKTDYARQFAFFMNEVHHRRSLVPQ
jgi:hypothetical protein